ncbi:MAG: glycosyltransferase [Sulfurospirillaceae bacterium]|nr:glycosyltransferase [Sulfurospirillaceae bacterium]
MKIVQLLPELNEGGVERGVVELSRELVKRGLQSVVISNGGKLVTQLERDGALHVKIDVCSKNIFTAPWRIFKLYQTLKSLKPDILHVRSRVPAWMVFFANAFLHIRIVSTVHGLNSVSLYSKIMTKGDHVICVSNAIKSYIQKHYATPENKITIIPRGIDLDKFNPAKIDSTFTHQFKQQFKLKGKLVISTVGRITQLKDLETFIEAIAMLSQEFPNVIGLIVGGVREDKQNYFTSLQNLVESLHVKEQIHFCGSTDKVAEMYTLSNVIVSSSKKPESFGRSVAEAIAMNTPVVATNHGGVLDIIKEGINGYFTKIGDAKDLAEKITQAKELRFDGYTYISQNFSLKQMVDATLNVYQKVLQPTLCHINLSAKYGGAEKNFVDTCNELTKHSFNIVAIVPRNTEYRDRFSALVNVIELSNSTSRHNPFLKRSLLKIFKKERPIIVHSHSAKATELIYNIHQALGTFKHFATKHNDRKGSIFNKVQYPIAVSRIVARSIKQEHVAVIYNGLTYKQPIPLSRSNVFTLLCVGRLDPIKQFDKLIDVISSLPFTCKLIIAGTGPQKKALQEQIMKLNLNNKVELIGFAEDVPSLMTSVDLLVINSKSEGFSYTILEGLFYAPALISTPVGIAQEALMPEMIFQENTLCEKILDVKNHYEAYQSQQLLLREKALASFTTIVATEQLASLYRSAL